MADVAQSASMKPRRGSARLALLNAAIGLVRKQGWAATSVDRLFAEAGVTKGAFFHYFASKDELGVAATQHWSDVTGPFETEHMEPSEAEVGRAESKQRRDLNKALLLAIKKRAKGTARRVSRGVLFQDFRGWFIAAPAAVWAERRKTHIELRCKPMGIDPVFWEIVDTESNASLPLSFRYFGAWTCSTPAVVDHELNETSADPDTIATEAITWLDEQIGQFNSWSVEHFLQLLRGHPRAASYIATIVTTMLLLGDHGPAEGLCRDAIARCDAGGFSVGGLTGPGRSFPELALAWLERKRGSRH